MVPRVAAALSLTMVLRVAPAWRRMRLALPLALLLIRLTGRA